VPLQEERVDLSVMVQWGHSKMTTVDPPDSEYAWVSILDFHPPEPWETHV
jgi:hypothetical protein